MRVNLLTIVGACVFVFGALVTGVELSSGSTGGGGLFGAFLAGPVLIVFGAVMVSFGSRRKRYSRRD